MTGIERAKESESRGPGYTRCGWLKQPKTIPMLFLGVATVGEKGAGEWPSGSKGYKVTVMDFQRSWA